MVEFKFEEDIPKELEKGNFSTAIMMCHDIIQLLLHNLLSVALLYLNRYREAFQYTMWPFRTKSFSTKTINKAYKMRLLSEDEKDLIVKVKNYRDKKVAHDSLFFDKHVLAGEIKLDEIFEIVRITKNLSLRLSSKLNAISRENLEDMKRVSENKEDINSVLKEHTHQKLISVIGGASEFGKHGV
jgi:hypothetical protein